MRFSGALLFLAVVATASHAATVRPLPSPAGRGSMAPFMAGDDSGRPILSWLEPEGKSAWSLKFSRFDSTGDSWGPAETAASGTDWFANWADVPTITPLGDGRVIAVWFVNNPDGEAAGHHGSGYHAVYSLSPDDGASWPAPHPVTSESGVSEFAAVLPIGTNKHALAAWLDPRNRGHHGDNQALYAKILSTDAPDQLVDASVCDCCQLSFTHVRSGALLAYRGRTVAEVRDIMIARWGDGEWEKPRLLNDDGWKIPACPVNGPQLASRGETVAAVWFTGADQRPTIRAKISRDGGDSFGEALQIDLGRPLGRVDTMVSSDGAAWFTWLEQTGMEKDREGGIYLRRLGPDGTLGDPMLIAASNTTRASGFPRIARLEDDRILVAYTRDEEPMSVQTLIVAP